MSENPTNIARIIEFTDSAFPIGTFSFSNGLETAADEGIVHDATTLEEYTRNIAQQAAYTDAIAAIQAFRSYKMKYFEGIIRADNRVLICKMNAESRLMTQRMGKKMAELAIHIISDNILSRWLYEINRSNTAGTYPVAQAIVFACCGISEKGLFCAHQYGVANTVLNAALRCVKVSHYDTQRILFSMSGDMNELYDTVKELNFDDMHTFVPQADILASLHEKGVKRMFMN